MGFMPVRDFFVWRKGCGAQRRRGLEAEAKRNVTEEGMGLIAKEHPVR